MQFSSMKAAAVAAAVLLGSSLVAGAQAAPVAGTWLSADGGTKVRVSECGGNRLCGKVVWLNEPIDKQTGKPKTDKRNADPDRRASAHRRAGRQRHGAERR